MDKATLRLELLKLCHRKDHREEMIISAVKVLEAFVLEEDNKETQPEVPLPQKGKGAKGNKADNPFA